MPLPEIETLRRIQVEFVGECCEPLEVTSLGGDRYRMESQPFLTEAASYRDVIEADPISESKIRFRRVVQPAGYRVYGHFIITPGQFRSIDAQQLLRRFESLGGHLEVMFDGLYVFCVPPDVDLDPTPWIERVGGRAF